MVVIMKITSSMHASSAISSKVISFPTLTICNTDDASCTHFVMRSQHIYAKIYYRATLNH